jgi:hypothetical protein
MNRVPGTLLVQPQTQPVSVIVIIPEHGVQPTL